MIGTYHKKGQCILFIVTYLCKILVIEWEISSLMITWLCVLKKNVTDSINNEAIINKNEKLVEGNFKNLCI